MTIQELLKRYAQSAQVSALTKTLDNHSVKTVFLDGLMGSSAPMLFAALRGHAMLFILQDADEAGYFYHDLVQMLGEKEVLFFPSSYRRAIKYAQRDAASEILRTEVLSKLAALKSQSIATLSTLVVTYPEALAELVVSQRTLDSRTLTLRQSETIDVDATAQSLRDLGFDEVDYVYEPVSFPY